jgi:ABC-type glycerol-3-phosphate transport system permease component
VDGAGLLRTFRSLVLPLSVPGFVVTVIWQFTSIWNDYLFAVFLSSKDNGPVILGLGGLDPVPWTPRKRGCSSWDAHVGGSLLSTKTKP